MWAAFYGPPERELLGLNGSRDEASFLVRLRGHEALASCRVSLAALPSLRCTVCADKLVTAEHHLPLRKVPTCWKSRWFEYPSESPASQGRYLLEVKVVRVPLVIPLALLAI